MQIDANGGKLSELSHQITCSFHFIGPIRSVVTGHFFLQVNLIGLFRF